ncbi:hypothetical protein [Williamsia soli]|uniref:hypothetical protein n=1 Tax=Williamsia soli TaxID=364929 RepID=UPI001A9F1DF6|nr:hypothetical protein [Williamsia soli]
MLTLAACGSNENGDGFALPTGANRDGPSTLQYGTDEYFDARIAMYEDEGYVEPGTLTREHLPWDPNGPTVRMSDLRALMIEATNARGQYADSADDFYNLLQNVQGVCDGAEFTGSLTDSLEYDKASYLDEAIGTLRLGSAVGDGGIDASGGIDCENGKIAGGTGHPIFSDYGPHDENDEIHDVYFDPLLAPRLTLIEPLTPLSRPAPRPATKSTTTTVPTTEAQGSQEVCGLTDFNQRTGMLTVFGPMTCDFGEALMQSGIDETVAQQSRSVTIKFRGGEWLCGSSGASSPLSCRNTGDSDTRVEWMPS